MRATPVEATSVRLLLLAWCVALLVFPGHFGSVDGERRLQVARSWWTSEPEVRADDADFGIAGPDGERRAWYGPGQSLVMLAPDVVASTLVEAVPALAATNGRTGGAVVNGLVALAAGPTVAAAAALLAFWLLQELGFSRAAAVGGVLGLVGASSYLHYAQLLQENMLTLLLTLAGFYGTARWARDGSRRHLIGASLCLGFDLLVRLTTVLDAAVVVAFGAVLVWRQGGGRNSRLWELVLVTLPLLATFLAIDRLYHFARFGEWTSTYIGLFGEAARAADPSLPASFPFNTPFATGLAGPFLSARKSIFLFDPLLLVVAVCAALGWRRWTRPVRAFVVATTALVVAHVAFYARYYNWGGDAAWGDRFVVSAVQLLATVAVPLLIEQARRVRRALWVVVALSFVIQLASLAFTFNLEIAQHDQLRGSSFVVGQRLVNVWHALAGQLPADPALRAMFSPAFGPFAWRSTLGPTLAGVASVAWLALLVAACLLAWSLLRSVRGARGRGGG